MRKQIMSMHKPGIFQLHRYLSNILITLSLIGLLLSSCQFRDLSRLQSNQSNLVQFVNPRIGTKSDFDISNGNTYPAVAHPWGMNFWTPQTEPHDSRWIYKYDNTAINGFRCTHQPSPWMGDYGAFSLMPEVGELIIDEEKRALNFYHTAETSLPDYYKVDFSEKKITAEMTATLRGAMMRFTFPESQSSWILVDAFPGGSFVKVIPSMQRVIGWCKNNSGGAPNEFATYFVVDFDKPFASFTMWNNDSLKTLQREIQGDHAGIALRFLHQHAAVRYQPEQGGHQVQFRPAQNQVESDLEHGAQQNRDRGRNRRTARNVLFLNVQNAAFSTRLLRDR